MNALATRAIEKTETLTILQRIAERDKTAVKDCIDAYGNFIWTLARKFTRSPEEAAKATEKIFADIWQHSERAGENHLVEEKLIARIALRRLIKSLPHPKQKSESNIDAANEQAAETDEISRLV